MQCFCVGVAALPVGFHLSSRVSLPQLTSLLAPAMADCTTQPAVSEIVSMADQLYDGNKMREGLQYLRQYEHMDEVEVRPLACVCAILLS